MLAQQLSVARKVAVAMSGGVDSSVAALVLKSAGYEVIGISMQVWDYRQHGGSCGKATCCAPSDFNDARKVAASIDAPYYVFDFERSFRSEVIDKFVSSYRSGFTPNPCVDCNNRVKFRELRDRVSALGFEKVATGHYAQIIEAVDGNRLARGVDPEKDQSYFLYGLKQDELAKTLFPIGHLTKPEVREIAKQAGLSTADKAESQDICFVSGTVQDFLVRLGAAKKAGNIVRRDGQVVGQHEGIHSFTVGQRKGLALGGNAEPLYVLELCAPSNTVIVGEASELEVLGFECDECNWSSPLVLSKLQKCDSPIEFEAIAQLRHRHAGVPVHVSVESAGVARAKFGSSWSLVSPGQAAVFYELDNMTVIGGGRITKALR